MMSVDESAQRIPLFNGLDDGTLGKIAEQQVAAVQKAQDQILDDWQRTVDGWCTRRHRTTDALTAFCNDALHAKSPQDAMHAWMNWYQGAMERLSEDVTEQTNVVTSVARCCAKGPITAALKAIPEVAEVTLTRQQSNGGDRSATHAVAP